jgi:hypothetical protein
LLELPEHKGRLPAVLGESWCDHCRWHCGYCSLPGKAAALSAAVVGTTIALNDALTPIVRLLSTLIQETGNSLCLTFALESFVDFLSSVAVLWRFFAPFAVDAAVEEKLDGREQRASMSISFVLIILGIAVMGTAIGDYTRGQEDPDSLRTL